MRGKQTRQGYGLFFGYTLLAAPMVSWAMLLAVQHSWPLELKRAG